jgi:hypothetical protein
MNTENWDPLEGNLTPDVVDTTIKRQIKNILKSYTGWFDPFSELIQNALDALDARKAENGQFTPKLWIQIDLEENMLSVTDNGIGFAEDQFKSFLAPNVSYKGKENRGNKGVGATYLAYGFNFLQVGTKTPGYEFIGTLKNGREWVEAESSTESRPEVRRENEALHSVFCEIDRGATFTLKLMGEFIRPQKLDWLSANTADQWSAILRIKTPLGGIYLFEVDSPRIQCALTVVDKNGKETTENLKDCDYLFPHKAISNCVDVDEILSTQDDPSQKRKNRSKLSQKYSKLNGVYKYWDTDSFISKAGEFGNRLKIEQKKLSAEYNLRCYGFFCYTTRIWDTYNDDILNIRSGERILRGGLQLATNTMPQGNLILIPLTSNIGYQHTTHVVIHLDQADPDLGRKGFQPEIEELSKFVSTQIVNYFLDWRECLQTDTGTSPNIVEQRQIYDWIRELEAHENEHPLIITREDAFLPLMEPSITAKPKSEQDVISLFNQLLAGGVIRGVKLMATNQYNQYDSVFRFHLRKPFENYIFDEDKNPLGLQQVTEEYESNPSILEYKYSFDALIEDLEKDIKKERDINLVVAWELGKNWHTRYDITPLLHRDYLQHRFFHGGTHLLKNQSTGDDAFSVIILSELIEYLNDPDSVQEYQSETYGT